MRAAVHRAVEEFLADNPAEGLTLPLIATRAGVHPTTLYRRWGSVADLMADVASSRFSGDIVVPDTGSLREDLRRWASDVATDLADPDTLAVIRASIGSSAEGGCACTADRHDQLTAMLDRERARGGAAPETPHAADMLLGPLYYRAIFTDEPADPGWTGQLVDTLLK
ncbi:hypothetical protein GCM10027445_41330 [Amycolatopsis endophytica]